MLAMNKARSGRSNTQEFLRPVKRRRANHADVYEPFSNMQDEGDSSSARTSTIKVDRDVQMKYDIAKNPEGPLGRTMHGKLAKHDPREVEGQGSGGVLSNLLKAALAAPETPTMPRHPGLQERFDNVEDHLRIRWGVYLTQCILNLPELNLIINISPWSSGGLAITPQVDRRTHHET